jgi:hypothetical protein
VLTEKTLELNLTAELFWLAKNAGYDPLVTGYSQLEETYHSIDSSFQVGSKIGIFQYKRGHARRNYFTFYINNNFRHDQHLNFYLIDRLTHACYYVFPLFVDQEELHKNSGKLFTQVPVLSPSMIPKLKPSNTSHRMKVYNDGTWECHSKMIRGYWSNFVPWNESTNSLVTENNYNVQLSNLPNARQFFSGINEYRFGKSLAKKLRSSSMFQFALFQKKA